MNIVLSIITVVKNAENTIYRTIESINKQIILYSDLVEYLIIDGNSTDKTIDICKSFQIKTYNQVGTGIYDAMNYGASICNGKFILFINADDELNPNAIKNILNSINLNPFVDLFLFPINLISKTKKIRIWYPYKTISRIYSMPAPHPGCVMSIYSFKILNGFNLNYKLSADYDLLLRALNIFKFSIESFSITSFYPGGVSSNFKGNIENIFIRYRNNMNIKNQVMGVLYDMYRFFRFLLN